MNTIIVERALILACWEGGDPLLAGLGREPALFDLAGKGLAQRSVEQAVALGARRIDVVLGDHAADYQACLGDGERWGCTIVYHYAAPGAQPLRSIARQQAGDGECLLLHADTNLPAGHLPGPGTIGCRREGAELRWCGWARAPGPVLADSLRRAGSRAALAEALLADPRLATDLAAPHASAETAAGLLAAAQDLLRAPDYPIGIARRPAADGVWLGNGTRIHPTAKIVAPVYVGDHVLVGPGAVIGPDAVIGAKSIVDRDSRVADSVVAPGSYVGAGIELRHAILAGRHLVNVALGVGVEIADRELAGAATGPTVAAGPGIPERLLAAGLWSLLWPLRLERRGRVAGTAVEAIYAGVPGGWSRHFREVFHPGLAAVVAGRLRLVGPQPRSEAELAKLPEAWQRLGRAARGGLINESLVLGPEGADPAIRYAGDVLAAQKSQFRHIAGTVLRYAGAVLADRQAGRPEGAPGMPGKRTRQPAAEPPALARDS